MTFPEHPTDGKIRRHPGWRPGYLVALSVLVAGAVWSACSIDERQVELGGLGGSTSINSLMGGSGGADGLESGSVDVQPASLDLGPVVVGSPVRARLRISNTGDVPLAAPSVALGSGTDPAFSILQNACDVSLLSGQVLPPGQSCEVRLQLLADRAASLSGQLAIDVAGATRSVPLAAQGNTPGELILAPAAGNSDNFGSVRLGNSAPAVFNLTNPGATASGPLSIHVFNADVSVLSGAAGSCVSGVTSLDAGQTCDLQLAFAPSQRGASDAMLVVTSPAGSVGLPLSGRGVVAGALGVSQPQLDFDGVVLGGAGNRALRVVNQGDEPLVLLGVTLAGDQASEFSIQSSDCTSGRSLAAGAGCDVTTEFRPATSGDGKSAALTVAMSGGAPQVVNLAGAGLDQGSLSLAPVAGGATDFGPIALGAERTQVFQVVNGSAQTSGPLALSAGGDFALVPASQPGDCESGQTSLDNAGSCTVTVKLAPQRRSAQFGSISIRSPLAKSASIALTGTGVAPALLAIAQDEINFGQVLTGGTYRASVTVQNKGDQPLPPPLATLVDPSGAMPVGFSVDNACTSPLGFQDSCAVNISFQPGQPGFPVALLRLETATAGAASALLYAEVSRAGTLVLAAADGASADFGDVGVGSTKNVSFTITNPDSAGSGRLSITASSPLFVIDLGNCTADGGSGLANGASCTFSVSYTAQSAEAVNATLSIQSPGAGGAALSLSAQGRSPASLVAVGNQDFATANIGQAAATDPRNDFTWSLQNQGDLATGVLQVSNSDPADFGIVSNGCNGQSLAGHTGCDVSIHFRPGSIGAHSADLVVVDAGGSPSVTLKMTGNGVQIAEPGQSCVTATCRTGTCTNGKCCDRECTGGCQQCDDTGVCNDQSNRESCGGVGGPGVCFGVNLCLFPEGNTCTTANQCGSGHCELKLGGSGASARVCCLQACAAGDQCSADGQGCQAPTLAAGAACGGNGQLPCGNGLTCKECLGGGSQCRGPDECCGGCPGTQVCTAGACACPAGPNGLQMVHCGSGRCIQNRADACCDTASGCNGDDVCNASTNLCGCPAGSRECTAGSNSCLPNNQCCNCGGPCQQCNTSTGACSTVGNGQPGRCGGGQVCQNGGCVVNNVGLGQPCNAQANNCSLGACNAGSGTCQCAGATPKACGTTRCVPSGGCCSDAECGPCLSCQANACRPLAAGQPDRCPGAQDVCDGQQRCITQLNLGQPCGQATQVCTQGNCTEGRCCPGMCGFGCRADGSCDCATGNFQNGSCRSPNGSQCTTNADCVGDDCNAWFADFDLDGFGTAANGSVVQLIVRTCGPEVPNGGPISGSSFVLNDDDCCDDNQQANTCQQCGR